MRTQFYTEILSGHDSQTTDQLWKRGKIWTASSFHLIILQIFLWKMQERACALRYSVVFKPLRAHRLYPLSKECSRQEYWSGLPFPTPGDLPDPGIKPVSPKLAGEFITTMPPGKPTGESLGKCEKGSALKVSQGREALECEVDTKNHSLKEEVIVTYPRGNQESHLPSSFKQTVV